ncbi:MAG TPA: RNA 2',3'-cyclic phosphodiesterase [Gammaproteobacteria bacterium]|nr:RNA 2',3'-cyclic phosphodiesterase [Gammaproteobacteria bacterium]
MPCKGCWTCSSNPMSAPEREHESPAERLFFALWPDDALRRQLTQCRDALAARAGGRPVSAENLHLTLAFLGRTDGRQRACVEAMADALHCPPFALLLNRSGYWPRPRVLWIGPAVMPEALIRLAAALRSGAEGCGLKLDASPYRAHITLLRKLARPAQAAACPPLNWPVDRFVLVRSRTLPEGVEYEVVREWGLGRG